MKRVLCLVSEMSAGGAETFLMKIYRCLDRSKYQMDFCVNVEKEGLYDAEIKALGGRIFHVPSKSENTKEFSKGLYNIVSENGYKNVMRITSNALGFYDLYIAKKAGAENLIARSSNSSDGGSLTSKIAHRIGKLLFKRFVDIKIAPSDLAAIYTFGKKDYSKGNVQILHNGIDFCEYGFSKNKRENIRKELGINESTVLLGHIGRFTGQKNHEFLLDVFYKVQKAHKDTVLLLIGKGEFEEKVRKKVALLGVENKVKFLGLRRDVPALLSAMDMFLLPSFYEGMPNVVIEAQAAGLNCLISDTITKEVALTPLVKQLPIKNADIWQKEITEKINHLTKNADEELINREKVLLPKSYDIAEVAKLFTAFLI